MTRTNLRAAILARAADDSPFSVDDVTSEAERGEKYDPHDAHQRGRTVAELQEEAWIVQTGGMKASRRPRSHASKVLQWRRHRDKTAEQCQQAAGASGYRPEPGLFDPPTGFVRLELLAVQAQ